MEIEERIKRGLAELPFETDEALARRCMIFIEQLVKWNQTYNLTAIRSPSEMVTRHILDSLAIAPYLPGLEIIDVGSGAGLPGIPLAINYPDKKFVLLDSSGKKTRFITHVVIELGLSNVEVVQSRVEDYQEKLFDHVVCRAFTALSNLSGKLSHLLKEGGSVLAMKGKEDTTLEADSRLMVKQTISYSVPLLNAERQLVELLPLGVNR
jgi:16S rRNA (guanine527-N7)-methyltransferase